MEGPPLSSVEWLPSEMLSIYHWAGAIPVGICPLRGDPFTIVDKYKAKKCKYAMCNLYT